MQQPALYPPEYAPRVPRRDLPRRRNRRCATMPTASVGPYVKLVFAEIARQGLRYSDIEELSGLQVASLKAWRRKNSPGHDSLNAVLGALKHALVPVPMLEALPHALAGEVTALALKLRMSMPETWAALVEIGVEQKLLRMRADERAAVLAGHDARMARVPCNDNTPAKREAASAT